MSTLTTQDTLAYEERGAGVPVVLLPGQTFERRIWRPVVDRLGDAVHTIAIDLPGQGQSAGPARPLTEVADQVNDLIERLGVERPIVVGHSMAGAIALIYAARYPVRGVVSIESPLDVRPFAARLKQLETALRGEAFDAAFAPIQDSLGLDLVPEPLRTLALDAQYIDRDVALGYFDELLQSDPDEKQASIEQIADGIDVPSLLVFGQRLSTEERDYILTHLSHAQVDEWDARGHLVHLAEADRFAARLRVFIDRCEPPLPGDLKTVEIDGARLAYRAQGSGEAVVFVHGSISDLTIWGPQLAPVGERYQAIAYSRRYAWPNHNRPLAPDYSPRTDARDLAGVIEQVAGGPAHVVAASIGACGALFVATERPELVRSLVVLEPPLLRWLLDIPGGRAVWSEFMTDVWDAAARAFGRGEPERGVAAFIDYFLGPGRYDRLPARARERIMQNAAELEAQARSTDRFPMLERASVTALPMPVLMLSGALTRPTHALVDAELERLLSHGRRIVVPGASHDVWVDRPDECVAATVGFLSDMEAGWKDG